MKDIMINVSRETRMVDISKSIIGNDGENLQGNLVFKFKDQFVNGIARLESDNGYIMLNKVSDSYVLPIKSILTKEGQINLQLVITEQEEELGIPIFKSNIFYMICNKSLNIESEEPEEYPQWIEVANSKLAQVQGAIESAEKVNINGIKEENKATISITNHLGETTEIELFDGVNGRDGRDGRDGADGKNGIDGYTPQKGIDYFDGKDGVQGPQGVPGPQGNPGVAGKDAKINGVNTLNIIEGTNIKLEQTGSTLKINSTGGGSSYDDTELREKINKVDEDLGITQQDVQELQNDVDNLEDTKADKTEIPDVSNFVDKNVNNLANYYLKSETYSQEEIDEKIGDIDTLLQDLNNGGGVE